VWIRTPWRPRREMSRFCEARMPSVQARSRLPVARPPAAATRAPSEGRRRTTSTRCPTTTRGRSPPARPTQLAIERGAVWPTLRPPAVASAIAATSAQRATMPALRPRLELVGREVPDRVEERGLHAREGEVEPRDVRDREGERLRIALAREAVERAAAGVAEPEEARALVEGLARRVVDRRPETREASVVTHVEEERVAAAREQAEEGRV